MSVSAEDVRWAYQTILGREVEDESVIERWVSFDADLKALVATLAASPEAHRGKEPPISTDDVRWAYRAILSRDPENEGILAKWVEMGVGLKALVGTLADSEEARRKRAMPPLFSYDCARDTQDRALAIIGRLTPFQAAGFEKVRLGGDHDGGYVMLDDFQDVRIAYSLGIKDDVSWDLALADKGIEIFQYDHTIERLPAEHPSFHWTRKGIEGQTSKDPNFVTLAEAIEANGHAGETDLLLKCDIEGAEWDMLVGAPASVLAQFRQIVIEVHFLNHLNQQMFAAHAAAAIDNLTRDHRVVHVHGNNCSSYAILGGVPLPAVLELTLVRHADKTMFLSNETYPTPLDRPCNPELADFKLGHFRF